LLSAVAARLWLKSLGREFLSTDAAFVPHDEFWRVSVVIEHENAVATARHEVYKLAHLSVPLRVLITYPWKVGEDQKRLQVYCEILEDLGANASGQLLVVFATINDSRDAINWRYYLYAGSEFFQILPGGKILVA
jgi:hypothetical protein